MLVKYVGRYTIITADCKDYVVARGNVRKELLCKKFDELRNVGVYYIGRRVVVNGKLLNVHKFLEVAKSKFYAKNEKPPFLMNIRVDNENIYNCEKHAPNTPNMYLSYEAAVANLSTKFIKRINNIKVRENFDIIIGNIKYNAEEVRDVIHKHFGIEMRDICAIKNMFHINTAERIISGYYLLRILIQIEIPAILKMWPKNNLVV